jgi:Thioredoxin
MNYPIESTIKNSLTTSLSYSEYRLHITKLLEKGLVTGHEQTEALVHYTELNEARMHRLDKTIQVTDEVRQFLENLKKEYLWLVISEGWCGDAAQILPVINKMAEVSDKIDFRIVLRDDNDELMHLFLTNGTKSIPILIIIDKQTNEVVNHFGPRPVGAKQLIIDYKAAHGIVDETAKINLQKWYLSDKGISTQNEIMALMK